MTSITLDRVSIEFPIASLRERSIKSQALRKARSVGGKLHATAGGLTVVRALDQVSLDFREGDRVALVGHNGAGKTTFLRTLAGIYAPTRGVMTATGRVVPMFDIFLGIDEEATGYENIVLRGLVLGLSRKEIDARIDEIAEFSDLGPYIDLPMRTYSAGMMFRLMFSITTSVAGDIVLMDEWISSGDAAFASKAEARLSEVVGKFGIVVLATHSMWLVRRLCNRVILLEGGQVKADGGVEEVLQPLGW